MTRDQAKECERVAVEFIFCSIVINENRVASELEARVIFAACCGGRELKTHDDFRELYRRLGDFHNAFDAR